MSDDLLRKIGTTDIEIKKLKKKSDTHDKVVDLVKGCGTDTFQGDESSLFIALAGMIPKKIGEGMGKKIAEMIGNRKFNSTNQIKEAATYLKKAKVAGEDVVDDMAAFEKATGVGILVTEETIDETIKTYMKSIDSQLAKGRPANKVGALFGRLSKNPALKWADKAKTKSMFENALDKYWGQETEEDLEAAKLLKKKEKELAKKLKKEKEAKKEEEKKSVRDTFETRELGSAINPPDILEEHKKRTGDKIVTRFPPEPNGFLHIGHAKAMNLSFGFAGEKGGYTYLRYDDTNPTKEEKKYFDAIVEMVEWLGFKPFKVTYSSDYFQDMYELAEKLIKKGLAYVDFSTKTEIKYQKEARVNSPYRDTDPVLNLRRFRDMKAGRYAEGECTLRCKIDMSHDNVNMRDFVAYRIMYVPHPRTAEWCIYPTYDYTHCICDSIEDITHSLCTLEFENRRESYFWLLEALEMYRPHVWEFSRLVVTTSLLSKRKINLLVKHGLVRDFDDPRLLTLAGLRRRGYTPTSILSFCNDVGVSRKENITSVLRLEQSCRKDLDPKALRAFCVIKPIKITLTNFDVSVDGTSVNAPNHPKDKTKGTRDLPLSNTVYISSRDFRMEDDKSYFGLAPNKAVGLRYGPVIYCDEVVTDQSQQIIELKAHIVREDENIEKPKGFIHWLANDVNGNAPATAEIRIYKCLFDYERLGKSINEFLPNRDPAKLIREVNENSEIVHKNALIDPLFANAEHREHFAHFQFERMGYFSVDPDTKKDDASSLVFNLTVSLKESKSLKK